MASEHLQRLHREGKISDTQYRRAGGICADEINDSEYQDDEGGFGPDDAGHIDAAANKRKFPKESVPGQQPLPSGRGPSDAQVRRSLGSEWNPNWYRDNTGQSRN